MSITHENVHDGHRARMREKLIKHGDDVFNTYEILEMLLYYVIPYRDTNPISKNLLSRFGSALGVLSASREELLSVDGVGEKTAELILSVGEFSRCLLSGGRETDDGFDNYAEIGRFLCDFYEKNAVEKGVYIMLLDSKLRLLGMEFICEVDYGSGAVRPELFVQNALNYNASAAVIAHAHPYGPLFPTESDTVTNALIEEALRNVGVFLLEHYIISGKSYVGFMKHLELAFSENAGINKFIESKGRV